VTRLGSTNLESVIAINVQCIIYRIDLSLVQYIRIQPVLYVLEKSNKGQNPDSRSSTSLETRSSSVARPRDNNKRCLNRTISINNWSLYLVGHTQRSSNLNRHLQIGHVSVEKEKQHICSNTITTNLSGATAWSSITRTINIPRVTGSNQTTEVWGMRYPFGVQSHCTGKSSEHSHESSKMEVNHCDRWPGCFAQTLSESRTAYTSWYSRIISAAARVKRELDNGKKREILRYSQATFWHSLD
jgi:hypothetical protein